MLTPAFIDWWFSPWSFGSHDHGIALLPAATGALGQRDGYRLWCFQAGVAPDFPGLCEPGWSIAASIDGGQLALTAQLFSGLIAARNHDQDELSALSFPDRKWCTSTAAIQPLQQYPGVAPAGVPLPIRGLYQLAAHLIQGFPGMWPRLRRLLEPDTAEAVDRILQGRPGRELAPPALSARAQKCWRICRLRAEASLTAAMFGHPLPIQ